LGKQLAMLTFLIFCSC